MALPVSTKAQSYDLNIAQGSSFTLPFVLKDKTTGVIFDLTGCTAIAKIRALFPDVSPIIALTAVVIPGPSSSIVLSLTPAQTTGLTIPAGTPVDTRVATIGQWNLDLTDGTNTYRFA